MARSDDHKGRPYGGRLRTFGARAARAFRAGVLDFLRDRRGGAMLVAGIGAATIMCAAGAGLVNLAWHEAHREELRAAMRAAVASVGATLLARAGDGGAVDQAIAERVDAFVEAASGADITEVTVTYDDGRIAVEIDGELDVDDLWGVGRMFFGGSFTETVAVRLESTRHEFALALDVSPSMGFTFDTGTRMDALKTALNTVASNLEAAQRDSPAGMLVAIVPFASAVRVADTGGAGETEHKQRYLRMMGGRLRAQWVDVNHGYGVGGMHEIDIPTGWDWDTDRWTGCVMARWGAYWEATARPTPMTWPASLNGEPLHLSDAPPVPGNANTLFTPYSWPDAGPAGNIDARVQWAMADILAGRSSTGARDWFGDNDWSLPDGRGAALCPDASVTPLTDDIAKVRTAVAALQPIDWGPGSHGWLSRAATYTHLGIVWGMRTLATDWRDIWNTRDFRGVRRPAPPAPDLLKTVLVVSDGSSHGGMHTFGQVGPLSSDLEGVAMNPFPGNPACIDAPWVYVGNVDPTGSNYESAAVKGRVDSTGQADDAAFNASFPSTWRTGLADALGVPTLATTLASLEPVDAFRGVSAAFGDALVAAGLPRPTQVRRHLCDYSSVFGPYGRLGDPRYVGGAPAFDGSPWKARKDLPSPYPADRPDFPVPGQMTPRLYEWWDQACALAAARAITVHTVFIGDANAYSAPHRASLTRCSTTTGGEAFMTPDADTLDDVLGRLIQPKRTLRFVD